MRRGGGGNIIASRGVEKELWKAPVGKRADMTDRGEEIDRMSVSIRVVKA